MPLLSILALQPKTVTKGEAMDDKTLSMTMLLDFYGELLTEKQRSCFVMHYNEDLSLAEIAEVMEISRQGVRDLIVRAEATLTETEEKLGFIERYREQRIVIEKMQSEIYELLKLSDGRVEELLQNLLLELNTIGN